MGRPVVTVVPVASGRFAILLVDPASPEGQESCPAKDANGYTEAELRRILQSCYRLSDAEISDSIEAARLKSLQRTS
jgi:hypothetical protein